MKFSTAFLLMLRLFQLNRKSIPFEQQIPTDIVLSVKKALLDPIIQEFL